MAVGGKGQSPLCLTHFRTLKGLASATVVGRPHNHLHAITEQVSSQCISFAHSGPGSRKLHVHLRATEKKGVHRGCSP